MNLLYRNLSVHEHTSLYVLLIYHYFSIRAHPKFAMYSNLANDQCSYMQQSAHNFDSKIFATKRHSRILPHNNVFQQH